MISIIVTLGFVGQKTRLDVPDGICRGDEFDHLAGGALTDVPCEVIIVDRAWPYRWDRVFKVFENKMERVKYISPKPSPMFSRGYRNTSAMRNSGAIVSSGGVLIFLDDYCYVEPRAVDRVWEEFLVDGALLHPTVKPVAPGQEGKFSGHNDKLYMCTRDQFIRLNGFEEHFDGAYGEEDTEFENRVDALIDQEWGQNRRRFKLCGVEFPFTPHHNGWYPIWHSSVTLLDSKPYNLDPPWPMPDGLSETDAQLWRRVLRCNRALFKNLYMPLISQRKRVAANQPITDDELVIIGKQPCEPNCPTCFRADRKQQLESYRTINPDAWVGHKMESSSEKFLNQSGLVDVPWGSL